MNWLDRFHRWRKQRLLRQERIPIDLWAQVSNEALARFHLSPHELHRLRELASLFLQRKSFSGAGGLVLDDKMRALIAVEACLLILNLDLEYFDGWLEIIVYPGSFVVEREQPDAIGLLHKRRAVLGGEAWDRGPLILAWEDAQPNALAHSGNSSVILHEFAHKLDMLNGAANGMPPLHADMDRYDWTRIFNHAYEQLRIRIEEQLRTDIDPYGAENPAEFFAVISEAFFLRPAQLYHDHLDLYDQLRLFYRQDPLQRCTKTT